MTGESLTLGGTTNATLASANAGSQSLSTAVTIANGTGTGFARSKNRANHRWHSRDCYKLCRHSDQDCSGNFSCEYCFDSRYVYLFNR